MYFCASHPDPQLDGMERMLGVGPDGPESTFRTNVSFLPVASTVLIRGEHDLIVDPGNAHIGNCGILYHAPPKRGLDLSDIDAVVLTHGHSDHKAPFFSSRASPGILARASWPRWRQ